MRFVDTNVLLYAVSTADDERGKTLRAREILESQDLGLSVQVLQEFYVQATRPTRSERLSHEQASTLVEALLRFPAQETTVALMQAAFETAAHYSVSYWDAAVIEAARSLGCDTLLTEDLGDGTDYRGVRVVNPFRGAGSG
ncbi:MAG TPA: PIN domain-containing protein [Vicinamibacteria bacterium]|nr:PIN domain-containing protein [Vicinamibacteria bacterium]